MWDISETISQALKVIAQWMYIKSPDQQSKRLDNEKRMDEKDIKERRLDHLARVRRFLAGKKVVVLLLLLIPLTSCARPFTDSERKSMQSRIDDLEFERMQLRNFLIECQERLDEVEKCAFTY